jgi:hypothetical protein
LINWIFGISTVHEIYLKIYSNYLQKKEAEEFTNPSILDSVKTWIFLLQFTKDLEFVEKY